MFASFKSDYNNAEYVLLGVPFDKTSSFRAGSVRAPDKIREASYCFEPYINEYDVFLTQLNLHDYGNLEKSSSIKNLGDKIKRVISEIIKDNKFPIMIGGEHSITPYAVSAYRKINVVVLDAHLDYRDKYEGLKHSHATVTKRISELSCVKDITVYGVRSFSKEESIVKKPSFYIPERKKEFIEKIKHKEYPVYLSIDMDVIDPAYAPGVGNPEPFGIKPLVVKDIISTLSSSLAGFDIVETNPKYDQGNITENLAARLIYEVIGATNKYKM